MNTLPMKPRILIVDDELDALELLSLKLTEAGMVPILGRDGAQALVMAREARPELIILDLTLPVVDGLEVCKTLRKDPATTAIPILMLTARAEEMDRVIGLELGASDYVTKPYSPRELVLRVRNLLVRGRQQGDTFTGLSVEGLEINVPIRTVIVNGKAVELTATEFNLLVALARERGRAQTRSCLQQSVLGYDDSVRSRTVDTHINRLKKKLGPAALYIEQVRFLGYRFAPEASAISSVDPKRNDLVDHAAAEN